VRFVDPKDYWTTIDRSFSLDDFFLFRLLYILQQENDFITGLFAPEAPPTVTPTSPSPANITFIHITRCLYDHDLYLAHPSSHPIFYSSLHYSGSKQHPSSNYASLYLFLPGSHSLFTSCTADKDKQLHWRCIV